MPQTKNQNPTEELFRVWNLRTDRPAYLAAGPGLPKEIAEQQAAGLADPTSVIKVYDPEEGELS